MGKKLVLEITDYHKFSNGQICLIGIPDLKEHDIITSQCRAEITVYSYIKKSLCIVGQEIISRSVKNSKNEQTFIRVSDNIDDILKYLGKKNILVTIYYPD